MIKKRKSIKLIVLTSIFIALCYVMPLVFHGLGLGNTLSPMHIPVLLCGLICGSYYGLYCGIAGPLLSSILSGMPTATSLLFIIPELAAYGLISGLILQHIHTKRIYADLYVALIAAMFLGRVVGGISRAFFFAGNSSLFNISIWITTYFVDTLPGILSHLILIPFLAVTLMKAKVIPNPYASLTYIKNSNTRI